MINKMILMNRLHHYKGTRGVIPKATKGTPKKFIIERFFLNNFLENDYGPKKYKKQKLYKTVF